MSVQLFEGDCLQIMQTLSDNSVDLTVTSPPYDNLRDYHGYSFDFENIAKELFRIMKSGGVIVWIVGDATVDGSETGTSFKQALYFKEIGFRLHDTMIWNKGGFSAVGALATRYAPVFEYMFVFSKNKLMTFNAIKDRPNKYAGTKIHGTVTNPDGSHKKVSGIGNIIPEYGQRFNVWEITPEKNSKAFGHPAMFPESLVKDHILSWSNSGDTVLDPFMGSGTTGKSAVVNDRKFIGIEISPKYFQIAKERIELAQL